MIAEQRRRNAYADHCCVCHAAVASGEGWLYSDTKSNRSRSYRSGSGRWIKKVKCDRCHSEGLTSKWQADNLDNPKPAAPVVRPWAVSQVRKWTLEVGEVEGDGGRDVALYIVGAFGRQLISSRDRIGGGFTAFSGYALEAGLVVDGKPLSKAAADELSPRITEVVSEVNRKELEGGPVAAALLAAAGVEAIKHPYAPFWSIRLGGLATLEGGYQAIAIELNLAGDYFAGYRITGHDRRSGVSLWVSLSVEEVVALAAGSPA
jgi:hypothetical protein